MPQPRRRATESLQKGHRWHTSRPRRTEEGQVGEKATPAKKAPTGAKKATDAREGSKTAKVLDLLKRPGGATAKELMKATGWQPHSVREVLSGTVSKKMRLAIVSTHGEDGERNYSIKT